MFLFIYLLQSNYVCILGTNLAFSTIWLLSSLLLFQLAFCCFTQPFVVLVSLLLFKVAFCYVKLLPSLSPLLVFLLCLNCNQPFHTFSLELVSSFLLLPSFTVLLDFRQPFTLNLGLLFATFSFYLTFCSFCIYLAFCFFQLDFNSIAFACLLTSFSFELAFYFSQL